MCSYHHQSPQKSLSIEKMSSSWCQYGFSQIWIFAGKLVLSLATRSVSLEVTGSFHSFPRKCLPENVSQIANSKHYSLLVLASRDGYAMDTADGARNCTTAFPQDSLTSVCSMAAACLLPTECCVLKGGDLIQFICIGSTEDVSQWSWQYFHWGQGMETWLQYLVPFPCFGGADLSTRPEAL